MRNTIILGLIGSAVLTLAVASASRGSSYGETPPVVSGPSESPEPMTCSQLAKYGQYDCPDSGNNETWDYTSPDCIPSCAEYTHTGAATACNAACTAACTDSGWVSPCFP